MNMDSKLGSFITSALNLKKITDIKLIVPKLKKNKVDETNILYGMALNTYRFNKYFTDTDKKRINFLNSVTVISQNAKNIKKLWIRFNALKEGVFLTRDLVSEPSNNLTPSLLAKEASKLRKFGLKVNILDEKN